MLNAVNIGVTAISNYYGELSGQMFAFFTIAIAASEVAIGLGLLVVWYKRKRTIDLHSLQSMKG
jgi:NADH-quinone oxidoreductase subunit K